MVETKQETTVQSYVVPFKSLVGFVINTDAPESINSSFVELMQNVQNNIEVKKVLAEASKNLSNIINNIDDKISLVAFVPNVFIPIKEENDSTIVNQFIEKLNETMLDMMGKENGNPDVPNEGS